MREHIGVEPRRMAELERSRRLWRECIDERIEASEILLERRRQLKKQRAELIAERTGDAAEFRGEILAVRQLRVVRNPSWRLECEFEGRRHLPGPSGKQLLRRHSVERVVDFDGRKSFCVVGKHLRGREIGRIEAPLPLRIVVAGRTYVNHVNWQIVRWVDWQITGVGFLIYQSSNLAIYQFAITTEAPVAHRRRRRSRRRPVRPRRRG